MSPLLFLGSSGLAAQHGQHGVLFRRAGGWCEQQIHTQPIPILHQHMVREAELRLFADIRTGQRSFRIGRALRGHMVYRSLWKFTVGLPGSSSGAAGADGFFDVTLFSNNAHASIRAPSTVKCSSDNRPPAGRRLRPRRKTADHGMGQQPSLF